MMGSTYGLTGTAPCITHHAAYRTVKRTVRDAFHKPHFPVHSGRDYNTATHSQPSRTSYTPVVLVLVQNLGRGFMKLLRLRISSLPFNYKVREPFIPMGSYVPPPSCRSMTTDECTPTYEGHSMASCKWRRSSGEITGVHVPELIGGDWSAHMEMVRS